MLLNFILSFVESLIYKGRGRESVVGVERLATGWTIWSSKPDRGKTLSFLHTHSDRLRSAQPLIQLAQGLLPGGKAAGTWR